MLTNMNFCVICNFPSSSSNMNQENDLLAKVFANLFASDGCLQLKPQHTFHFCKTFLIDNFNLSFLFKLQKIGTGQTNKL